MADYGYPKETQRDVRTVVLDLPRPVDSTTDIDGERPPIKLHGPLSEDEKPSEGNYRKAEALDIEGTTVRVHYNPTLGPGRYRVLVYQSRIEAEDGDSYDLRNEDQTHFVGWDIKVLQAEPRHGARPPTREPDEPEEEIFYEVLLDGDPAPKFEMSGEVLTIVTEDPASVELEIEPLYAQENRSLYENYLSRKEHTVDGQPAVSYFAAGPVFDYKYGLYNGHDTMGRVPVDADTKRAGVYLPLFREPVPAQYDPLVDTDTEVVEVEGNSYYKTSYTIRPQVDVGNLFAYETPDFVFPIQVNNEYNTPDRNPRLFPHSVFVPQNCVPVETNTGPLDLPLHSCLHVCIGDERVWTGQTRLLPMLVTLRQVKAELGWDIHGPIQRREALQRIWHASQEALDLWKCPFRSSRVPASLMEFVLTRLANPVSRTDGTQGAVTTRLGDEAFTGRSDNAAARRLSGLSQLISECESEVPIEVEDLIPTGSAGLAENANNEWYPALNQHSRGAQRRIAPAYDPTYRRSLRPHRGEFLRWNVL